jgi:hypothetical protein
LGWYLDDSAKGVINPARLMMTLRAILERFWPQGKIKT